MFPDVTSQFIINFQSHQYTLMREPGHDVARTGIGVFIQLNGHHTVKLYISAVLPPVESALQAEAYGLLCLI